MRDVTLESICATVGFVGKQELVEAYTEGALSRRAFIRKLVAGGVSFGAAVAYAQLLDRDAAHAARAHGDEYSFIEVKATILDQDLDDVVATGKLLTKVRSDRKAVINLEVFLSRPDATYTYSWIGQKTVEFKEPGKKRIKVPLAVNPPHSVDALRNRSEAHLDLRVVARRSRNPEWGYDGDSRTLYP
jgi:hypothetical protein